MDGKGGVRMHSSDGKDGPGASGPAPGQGARDESGGAHGRPHSAAWAEEDDARLARRLARIRHTIVVLSGKGGVGKSTVAVNLAVALAESGKRVGLLDIDLHGPSIPKMLHLEGQKVACLPDGTPLPVPFSPRLKVMSIGFFLESADEAIIWRGPRKFSLIRQLLSDVQWADLDFLIVDAPPGTGDEPLGVLELLGTIDGAVVVTTPQQLSVVDVRRSIAFCRELRCTVLGIIENMSTLACPHCGETLDVFGSHGGEALAREAGVPFLGAIPMDPAVALSGDSGRPYLLSAASPPAAEAFRAAIAPLLALDHEDERGE